MGKKSKIKKITEKQYMEYVAGLKNEPCAEPDTDNTNRNKNQDSDKNKTNK